jgi:pimeloyl-ACP methyl ester carboxylesterase
MIANALLRGLIAASISVLACDIVSAADKYPPVPTIDAASSFGYFYAGGHYVGESGKQVMQGAMYVEVMRPRKVSQPYPLVLIHGAAQTATNWLGTPDGRKGWAQYFLARGYVVYMVDQPARGRSAWHPGIDGPLRNFPAPTLEKLFTAPSESGSWPQAKKHTQWPGDGPAKGHMGDPIFDAFYATQVEFLTSNAETQKLVQDAGAAMLDRIGPAVLLTHSQSGPFGWLIADVRPDLVKGIIAIEPSGPPFQDVIIGDGKARAWGPTDIKLTYDPPVAGPEEISVVQQDKPDALDLYACWLQKEPARKLKNLARIPILIVTSEASYHAVYDHCTAKYLSQAGAKVDFIRLEQIGIKGNGHMMMLEKNNLDVARVLSNWSAKTIK